MKSGAAFNPFSVQRIGPFNIGYIMPSPDDFKKLVDSLAAAGWRGEIVGPHGVGKSTLAASLMMTAQERGLAVHRFFLNDENPKLPKAWWFQARMADVVFLDGAGLITMNMFLRLESWTKRKGKGLVLTNHVGLGMEWSYKVDVDLAVFHRLVEQLLEGTSASVGLGFSSDILTRHNGNARTALFELYDWWEDRGAGQCVVRSETDGSPKMTA